MMILPSNIGGLGGGHWQTVTQTHNNSFIVPYLTHTGTAALAAAQQAAYSAYAQQAAFAALSQQAAFAALSQQAAYQPAPDPPVEDAGISAGEIIGWRCWRWRKGFLWSMYCDAAWAPNEAMTGKPKDGLGVHAWKEMRGAIEYSDCYSNHTVIIGKVKLWGEVIEHERGYRAEFGKIESLEYVANKRFFKRLILRAANRDYIVSGQSSMMEK